MNILMREVPQMRIAMNVSMLNVPQIRFYWSVNERFVAWCSAMRFRVSGNEHISVRLAANLHAGWFAANERSGNSAETQIIGHLFRK